MDLTEDPERHGSGPDDWVLSTLPPPCAVASGAGSVAVAPNYTVEWINKNRRIHALREVCGTLCQSEAEKMRLRDE